MNGRLTLEDLLAIAAVVALLALLLWKARR
jgi:hypothetical protein